MKMERRTFRIGELTRVLSQKGPEIEASAIRFWEKEFNISPKRTQNGQRYYDETDVHNFLKIRELLYDKRFTIEGARQALFSHPNNSTASHGKKEIKNPGDADQRAFLSNLGKLKTQLIKLRELL